MVFDGGRKTTRSGCSHEFIFRHRYSYSRDCSHYIRLTSSLTISSLLSLVRTRPSAEREQPKERQNTQHHNEDEDRQTSAEEARADGRNDLVDRRLLAALLCCELKRPAAAGDRVAAGRAPLRRRVHGRRLCVSS